MTDRELLELAAKAAGLDDARWQDGIWSEKLWEVIGEGYWNPLEKDDDAFRLMVDLRLMIDQNRAADQQGWVAAERYGCEGCFSPASAVEDGFDESGRAAATRRAIVRASAEIGRGMG
ncbi:hypothetical protein [Robbsia andropogonis]|uniref:hypothetical protein n=1 Tax=Robbsia andropogonis TaxID=28092 RepID=UPI0020A1B1E8|nr:hypothetical protein [Robbsia andropogonis]MCP1116996.1 hypothetical protein [Robbsia andropogonis]MCP1126325.1 hypothetical protein [Robbsia andropogonis]